MEIDFMQIDRIKQYQFIKMENVNFWAFSFEKKVQSTWTIVIKLKNIRERCFPPRAEVMIVECETETVTLYLYILWNASWLL